LLAATVFGDGSALLAGEGSAAVLVMSVAGEFGGGFLCCGVVDEVFAG